jgi:beta-aspartyl-dipeptidase (metallo-type)
VQTVSDLRVGGLISGKVGVLHMHMGNAPTALELAWQLLNKTTIPIKHMYPTHVSSRGPQLIEETKRWIAAGGVADFTADDGSNDTSCIDTLVKYRNEGVNLASISVSSDAYG